MLSRYIIWYFEFVYEFCAGIKWLLSLNYEETVDSFNFLSFSIQYK